MVWVESVSPSFRARHHIEHADEAQRLLYDLEHARSRLERRFTRVPDGMTLVLHDGPLGLAFTNPLLPAVWAVAASSSRRYIAGWVGASELHVLSPRALDARASNLEGSKAMLALAPAALYTKRVIVENNPVLVNASPPRRAALELQWAWLVEGGARWFAGHTDHVARALAQRLREGPPPRFPPALADAALLGQTVIDLLADARGEQAAARLVCQLGSTDALAEAFGVRSMRKLERAWRTHLSRLAADTQRSAERERLAA